MQPLGIDITLGGIGNAITIIGILVTFLAYNGVPMAELEPGLMA